MGRLGGCRLEAWSDMRLSPPFVADGICSCPAPSVVDDAIRRSSGRWRRGIHVAPRVASDL